MSFPLMQPPQHAAPISMNDTGRLFAALADELAEVVLTTMRSGRWIGGARTEVFADAFARYLGVAYCSPVGNGTDAIEISLRGLFATERARGSEVITVANAGGYTVTACRQLGLVPVFADIVEESQLVDFDSVVAALCDDTAVVVVTHLYGGIVDVPRLRGAIDTAGFAHVPIVEDCAQAHGGRVDGRAAGSVGEIATFSFYPTKNLGAMGDAGAVVTSDPELASAVRQLHQYGWSKRYDVALSGGRNSRMDEVQAAVLTVLLPHLDDFNARRRAILKIFADANPALPFVRSMTDTVAHLAVTLTDARDQFRDFLKDRGIASDIHYPILDCDQLGWAAQPQRVGPRGLDVSRQSIRQIVSIPCFPFLTDSEVDRIAEALAAWGKHG